MKPFQFRLERLLRMRERHEQARASELGTARREAEQREAEAARAREHVAACGEQAAEALESSRSAGLLGLFGVVLRSALDRSESAEQAHDLALENVRERERHFGEARRDRRSLERLREQREDEHRGEASRAEQSHIDENARQSRKEAA